MQKQTNHIVSKRRLLPTRTRRKNESFSIADDELLRNGKKLSAGLPVVDTFHGRFFFISGHIHVGSTVVLNTLGWCR